MVDSEIVLEFVTANGDVVDETDALVSQLGDSVPVMVGLLRDDCGVSEVEMDAAVLVSEKVEFGPREVVWLSVKLGIVAGGVTVVSTVPDDIVDVVLGNEGTEDEPLRLSEAMPEDEGAPVDMDVVEEILLVAIVVRPDSLTDVKDSLALRGRDEVSEAEVPVVTIDEFVETGAVVGTSVVAVTDPLAGGVTELVDSEVTADIRGVELGDSVCSVELAVRDSVFTEGKVVVEIETGLEVNPWLVDIVVEPVTVQERLDDGTAVNDEIIEVEDSTDSGNPLEDELERVSGGAILLERLPDAVVGNALEIPNVVTEPLEDKDSD